MHSVEKSQAFDVHSRFIEDNNLPHDRVDANPVC